MWKQQIWYFKEGKGKIYDERDEYAGGVIGLVSSILVLLVFVAIFVVAVVALARPYMMRGWRMPRSRARWR